ncbi:MAG: glycosyltransferase family 4 protein [Caldilineaceae bacterium]
MAKGRPPNLIVQILIVTQWYLPEPPGTIVQDLAQTLQAFGHDVTVLTGFPNYPAGKIYPGYHQRLQQRETIAGVPVVRIPLYPNHGRSSLKRALNYTSFALSGSILGSFVLPKPDVIFGYDSLVGVGVPSMLLSRRWNVPFVYQIQDLWPESLVATGMARQPKVLQYIGALANRIYCRAARICVISPGFRTNLIEKGVPAEKIHVISNWVDTTACLPADKDDGLVKSLMLDGKFTVMFAGNIGKAQGLDTILSAAELVRTEEDIEFVMVGDGVALPQLKAEALQRNIRNVHFVGRFPPGQMPQFYALADALLVHLKDEPLFQITIPHKTFSYMAAAKPILMAAVGDAADVIKQANAGITCKPNDPVALADAVCTLRSISVEERKHLGINARRAAEQQYEKSILVRKIENVLLSAVSGSAN